MGSIGGQFASGLAPQGGGALHPQGSYPQGGAGLHPQGGGGAILAGVATGLIVELLKSKAMQKQMKNAGRLVIKKGGDWILDGVHIPKSFLRQF